MNHYNAYLDIQDKYVQCGRVKLHKNNESKEM
jgi:hypothetical protein